MTCIKPLCASGDRMLDALTPGFSFLLVQQPSRRNFEVRADGPPSACLRGKLEFSARACATNMSFLRGLLIRRKRLAKMRRMSSCSPAATRRASLEKYWRLRLYSGAQPGNHPG